MTDRDIMLKLLREAPGGITTSWDWQMDLKFSREVGDNEAVEDLEALLKSGSPHPRLIIFWDRVIRPNITRRRLRALRQLVCEGLVVTDWAGTGPGGYTDFGVRRIRGYELKEESDESD